MVKKAKTTKSKNNDFFAADAKHLKYAIIVLLLVGVLFWAINKGSRNDALPVGDKAVEEYSPALNDSVDLENAIKEMDSKDLDLIDMELKDLESETKEL